MKLKGWATILVLIAGGLGIAAYFYLKPKPNIILITADDLGIGRFKIALEGMNENAYVSDILERDTGEYELKQNVIDARKSISYMTQLAQEGTYFENAFAASPWCSPSRLALLTAQYPQRNKVWYGSDVVRGEATQNSTFLTHLFWKKGYETGIIGKWHLGNNEIIGRKPSQHPSNKGFDRYWGFDNSGTLYYDSDLLESSDGMESSSGFLTHEILEQSIDFISNVQQKNFFLYLAFNAPHGPLNLAPRKYYEQFDHRDSYELNDTTFHFIKDEYSKNVNYHAHVKAMDKAIEDLISYLRKSGLSENTILVFTSDHGAAGFNGIPLPSNSPYKGYKGQLYEGALRTPMFFWSDGDWISKNRVSQLVSHMDIIPTCMELCGIKNSEQQQLDGKSLTALLSEQKSEVGKIHENLVWSGYDSNQQIVRADTVKLTKTPHWVIFDNEYKLRYIEDEGLGLYSKDDYAEANNLISENPSRTRQLHEQYAYWYEEIAEVPYIDREIYNFISPRFSSRFLPQAQ